MAKQIELGSESREKLMNGINKLADAVVCTLGCSGRNVLMGGSGQLPKSTKDGVSVAKAISLSDNIEDLGAQLVKQASIKTAEKAGDGTTTSTLLAREIVKDGLEYLSNGVNAVELKRGIDKAVEQVIEFIKENIAEDISSEDQLQQIATISANNDIEVGKLIAAAIEKVGKDGVVHIEESNTSETYLETVEGMQFDRGYKSHYFVTDNDTMTCALKDPFIFIANQKFRNVKELLPILEYCSAENKPLLIVAEDIEHEALATLVVNKSRGILNCAAVKAPDFGDRRKLILEDIAVLTGGTVFDETKGMKLKQFEKEWFGEARAVTITKETTTIVDGKGDEDIINRRVDELQKQIENSTTAYEEEKLQDRLSKMIGGVSIIHVGGHNETEMHEKKDRVDDALQATKAALEEGIIPGGGTALLYAREALSNDTLAEKIVYSVCGKPFQQILENAGMETIDIYKVSYGLGDDLWNGYNIKDNEIVNMKEAGIIDPMKVCRVALENAASVAGTILLTECIIVDEEDTKEESAGIDLSQFGM